MSLLLKLRDSSGCYCCFPTLSVFLLYLWHPAIVSWRPEQFEKNEINVWVSLKMFILFTKIYNGLKLIFIYCTPEIAKLQIKCSQIYSLCLLLRKFSNAVLSIQTFVKAKLYICLASNKFVPMLEEQINFQDFSPASCIASCVEKVSFC
jgi:hypothetical protein